MKLYVMRHGPAEDYAESGRDEDRALTSSGRDRTRAVAKALADAGESPATIFTSPLVRCVQTAEIVAIATKLADHGGAVEAHRELRPSGSAMRLVEHLEASPRPRVMLCGHEPDVSRLVEEILGDPLGMPFQKAMVVGVRIRDGQAELRFILDPKTLAFDPDRR
jgi:phosphohistidine phosphatase